MKHNRQFDRSMPKTYQEKKQLPHDSSILKTHHQSQYPSFPRVTHKSHHFNKPDTIYHPAVSESNINISDSRDQKTVTEPLVVACKPTHEASDCRQPNVPIKGDKVDEWWLEYDNYLSKILK